MSDKKELVDVLCGGNDKALGEALLAKARSQYNEFVYITHYELDRRKRRLFGASLEGYFKPKKGEVFNIQLNRERFRIMKV